MRLMRLMPPFQGDRRDKGNSRQPNNAEEGTWQLMLYYAAEI